MTRGLEALVRNLGSKHDLIFFFLIYHFVEGILGRENKSSLIAFQSSKSHVLGEPLAGANWDDPKCIVGVNLDPHPIVKKHCCVSSSSA